MGLRPATLLKKRLWHRWFPVNFGRFLITSFFIEHLRWLLLIVVWKAFVVFEISFRVWSKPLTSYRNRQEPEANLEPRQTYEMESYRKIISSFRLLNIFAKNSTLDVSQDSEYASENTVNNCFVNSFFSRHKL